jgi:predicted O-methyltransferase YrrM
MQTLKLIGLPLEHSWWKPTKPEELKPIPWLHPAMVSYLDNLIQPEWTVLEFGSGGSTLWLSERAHRVVSIEKNPQYYDALLPRTPANVSLLKDPPTFGKFDLLLIDGEPVIERAWYLRRATTLVVPGGIVVLDNANRTEYEVDRKKMQQTAKHFITFLVNPPEHKYCVTEFYRLNGGHENWI